MQTSSYVVDISKNLERPIWATSATGLPNLWSPRDQSGQTSPELVKMMGKWKEIRGMMGFHMLRQVGHVLAQDLERR